MKLLNSGFTTAETTFVGTTGGSGGASTAGGSMPVGPGSFHVQKIVFTAGSSVAANTSGGIMFRYGQSSDAIESTIVLVGGPSSEGIYAEFDDLDIRCQWFEAATNEAGAMGYTVFVYGD